jgi:PAS domain-containing protein
VVERASDGIVVVTEGIIHFANPKMAEMLGYNLVVCQPFPFG